MADTITAQVQTCNVRDYKHFSYALEKYSTLSQYDFISHLQLVCQ